MGRPDVATTSDQPGTAEVYYRSRQGISLPDAPGAFESWGQEEGLSRMMRDYFTVAENCGGRAVSIHWDANRPTIALTFTPLPMIAMGPTAFDLTADRRAIGVPVKGGLLVMPECQPYLVITLERRPQDVEASVDLVDYRPRFGDLASVRWIYAHTQVPIHGWVGQVYLRRFRRQWSG
jgi:hypothetical protein